MQMHAGLFRCLFQRFVAEGRALVFDFLRGLPEKQIGADGGAEHRHHHGDIFAFEREVGQQRAAERFFERYVHHQHGADIGEQRQRQPFEDGRITRKRYEDLQHQTDQREEHDVDVAAAAGDQHQCGAHRAEIGGDVDGVGNQQQRNDEVEQRPREMGADIGGKPVAGDATDACADDLDADHQRRGDQYRPQHAVAELRAGLRIGRNAAGVVVGGAGDEAGAELFQQWHIVRRTVVLLACHRFSGALPQPSRLEHAREAAVPGELVP